jgi:hypothetical protein
VRFDLSLGAKLRVSGQAPESGSSAVQDLSVSLCTEVRVGLTVFPLVSGKKITLRTKEKPLSQVSTLNCQCVRHVVDHESTHHNGHVQPFA